MTLVKKKTNADAEDLEDAQTEGQNLQRIKLDGIAKSPPSDVTAVFGISTDSTYAFAFEKLLRLGGLNFYLTIGIAK